MSQKNNRFLITQSLLSAWRWSLVLDNGYEDFLKTLHRKPIQQTKAMLDGIRFENILNATLNGAELEPTHEWHKPITALYGELKGAQQQVRLSADLTVQGMPFVLYGVLDFLKAGIVYDTKYSKTYRVGKYIDSVQHSAYFFLVPEAREFQYKICDGKYIYTETYYPDAAEPIEHIISNFMDFLNRMKLIDTYCKNWRSKY